MSIATQQPANRTAAIPFSVHHHLRVVQGEGVRSSACEHCALAAVCVPEELALQERQDFTALIFQHKRLRAGETLFHAGESFAHLYFVKTGSLKTVVLLDDGREQVTGFHFAGDVLGIDAISSPHHPSEAVAMTDTHVCAIPFAQLTQLSYRVEHLQTWLRRLLAREVVRDQGLMLLLGRMHAEERVAAFLMNLSNRFRARGYSGQEFTLPMAREDIGNYLGLTLETVSRCFSRLKNARALDVDNRRIRITDIDALKGAVGSKERLDEPKRKMAGK
jgi:CRP/FNR family transcriptional regulator